MKPKMDRRVTTRILRNITKDIEKAYAHERKVLARYAATSPLRAGDVYVKRHLGKKYFYRVVRVGARQKGCRGMVQWYAEGRRCCKDGEIRCGYDRVTQDDWSPERLLRTAAAA